MVFSSMVFLCVFLPIIFCLHSLLQGMRAKNFLLIAASLLFYSYGEPIYVLLLILSVVVNYLCALFICGESSRKKSVLILAVIINISLLVIFKYAAFLVEMVNMICGNRIPVPQIRLPIGISFFTFQALSYVIDVYRGNVKAQKKIDYVLLYISFFPQLIAGPIVKYHDVELEIQNRTQTLADTSRGIRRFISGLCKKVLIANTMAQVADTLFAAPESEIQILGAWLATVSYCFQIYFDFSGYSDMAIGLGWMFGFHFKENFDYPFISKSIQEVWRRWHISLSGWFQEYLYIPLGGNRKGKKRTIFNKLIVFLATGIWHGAAISYLFWGIYQWVFMMLEEMVPAIRSTGGKVKSVIQHIYAMLVFGIGLVFFRTESMVKGAFWVKQMFVGFGNNPAAVNLAIQQMTPVYFIILVVAILASTPIKKLVENKKGYEAVTYILSLVGFILCVLNLAGGTYNPFIYFRF